jgi:hypothetical protein
LSATHSIVSAQKRLDYDCMYYLLVILGALVIQVLEKILPYHATTK